MASAGVAGRKRRIYRWTPLFGPRGAVIKMDLRGLPALVFVCLFSNCAPKHIGKERTRQNESGPSALSLFLGCLFLPPQAV